MSGLEENNDEERNVRQRTEDEPLITYEPYSIDHRIPPRYQDISVDQLLGDEPRQKKTKIVLQLIRIVSGSSDNRSHGSFTYYKRAQKDRSMNATYSRMFLFREVKSGIGQVVYIIEGKYLNERLWIRNPQLRDNGTITIGTYIAVINPEPIVNMLGNEIPLLETRASACILQMPPMLIPICINPSLPPNVTRAFVLNGVKLSNLATNFESTGCSGLFCDRQRPQEILRSGKGCGCYSMQTRNSNIAIVHTLAVNEDGVRLFVTKGFSSLQFSLLYLSNHLPTISRLSEYTNFSATDDIDDCADQVIEYINDNGGFTIIGWNKRGEIDDQIFKDDNSSNNNNNERVEAGEMGYHIVSIRPLLTNINFDGLKYDVSNLNQG